MVMIRRYIQKKTMVRMVNIYSETWHIPAWSITVYQVNFPFQTEYERCIVGEHQHRNIGGTSNALSAEASD